ncbi:HNH endonuclease [Corallococcus sp. bb12-1]|uniref:HNH endonuclease n=1 Tax=Corallococcus sp. bb12-1 TaxID=2996784 RepID=UPI003B63CA57
MSSDHSALARLAEQCQELGISLNDALTEKTQELALRSFWRCLPSDRIKEEQFPSYVTEVTGRLPSDLLLALIKETKRGSQISDPDYRLLERNQNSRCALCGTVLLATVSPHVDHRIPLALGGKNSLSNLQILCQNCNLGKGALLNWMMGSPFFDECRGELSKRMRYCVLSKHNGTCIHSDCEETARTSELFAIPVVPVQRGGRLIFDNLVSNCEQHYHDYQQRLLLDAQAGVRRLRAGVTRFRTRSS